MRLFVLPLIFFLLTAGFIGPIQSGDLTSETDARDIGKPKGNTTTTSTTASTTTGPTTTQPTTTTSTVLPDTTTVPTTLPTTVAPKPNPPSTLGTWNVTDPETNVTCIVVQLAAEFLVPYTTTDGKIRNATLSLPNNAASSGHCNGLKAENQTIALHWFEDAPNETNKLVLTFRKNQTKLHQSVDSGIDQDHYALSDVHLSISPDTAHFPNASNRRVVADASDINLYSTNLNNSHICNSNQSVLLTSGATNDTAIVYLSKVHMEAFRTKPNATFSTAEYCSADGTFTSDVVPIAVGCALAALVVIVLIAYLVGRRRARQRGYQSV